MKDRGSALGGIAQRRLGIEIENNQDWKDVLEMKKALLALIKAAEEAPDPLDRIWCDTCSTSPLPLVSETITKGDKSWRRDYFKHDDSCWYGALQNALKAAKETLKQAEAKNCVCHSGSVCTKACETKHHDGCFKS